MSALKVGVVASVATLAAWRVYREVVKGLGPPGKEIVEHRSGGTLVAEELVRQGVTDVFVLSGGHVAPVYCAAEHLGIRVIDVRHEVNAVFAADAMWRLTGVPGVACVTAGPGVTNTVTAVKNAAMAESAVVVLGGATATTTRGRGALQDIDHCRLMSSVCKACFSPSSIVELVPVIRQAFQVSQQGIPGPVFVELPVDLTWPAKEVIKTTESMMPRAGKLLSNLIRWYLYRALANIYASLPVAPHIPGDAAPVVPVQKPSKRIVETVAGMISKAKRPVIVMGSQAMLGTAKAGPEALSAAVASLGVPTYVAGMARGLLNDPEGKNGEKIREGRAYRYKRSAALKDADLVILAGAVCDFRLQYGFTIGSRAKCVAVNRSRSAAFMNKVPDVAAVCDPYHFLIQLAATSARWCPSPEMDAERGGWIAKLDKNQGDQEASIRSNAATRPAAYINPVRLCVDLNAHLPPRSTLVMDGGDFVGTAANVLVPRGGLCWLDPGAFGTLGVGAGFAMAAKVSRPSSEVWVFYGDGACGFSIVEFDTCVRFKIGIIAVVGNDAGWTQIARDQEKILESSAACKLAHSDYHLVAEAFGGKGFLVRDECELADAVSAAKGYAAEGIPCLINCLVARNDFREGSISV